MIVETAYDKDLVIPGGQHEVRCINRGNIEDAMIWISRGGAESRRALEEHQIQVD
jgi:3-phosphoglycerate kinase